MALKGAGQRRPFFGKDEFAYDPERDLYACPAGESLVPHMPNVARSLIGYRAKTGTCDACSLKAQCTTTKTRRQILRHFDEEYVDRVKGYPTTRPTLSVHHISFMWALCHELVLSDTQRCPACRGAGWPFLAIWAIRPRSRRRSRVSNES
jgi:hypothetical protein